MSKKIIGTSLVISVLLTSCALLAFAFCGITSLNYVGSLDYFNNPENYDTFDVTVSNVNLANGDIYFVAEHSNEYYSSNFMLDGTNASTVTERNFPDVLQEKATITLTTTLKRTTNEWYNVVVGVSANGTTYLAQEEGIQNLIADQEQLRQSASTLVLATGICLGSLAAISIVLLIVAKKKHVF